MDNKLGFPGVMPETDSRNIRIGVFGTYGFENMGDAAVADATIASLRRHIPGSEIVGICQQPENVSIRHNIEAYSIFRVFLTKSEAVWSEADESDQDVVVDASVMTKLISLVKSSTLIYKSVKFVQHTFQLIPTLFKELKFSFTVYKIVRNLDLIVMSGSGQLNEEWGGPWRYPFSLFRWCLLARLAGCKIAFLSVGAGEVNSFWAKLFCSSALRLAHYISVRDVRTKELVDSWHVGTVLLVPDMAFSMKFQTDEQPARTGSSLTIGINPISFCDPRTWNIPDQAVYDAYVEKVANFCNILLSKGHSLVFIPNELLMDNLTIDDIINNLAPAYSDSPRIMRPEISNYTELFQSFAKCDYTICCRFHGLLFSFMSGKPVIALAHHYKFFTLAKEMGQEKYCLDISEFEVDVLVNLFNDLIRNKKTVTETIKTKSENYCDQVEKQYREMKNFI